MKMDQEAPARAAYAHQQSRKGDWMQTASGRMFWPMDPRADEVHITDIAHALSHLCRFGGHCNWFYSVAQHSVYVSRVVPKEFALAGLLHDGTEAYCVDVPRPIKRFLAGYQDIENRIWRAVAAKFGLPLELPACVHEADNAVLLAEKEQIMLPSPAPWCLPGEPAPNLMILPWTPKQASTAFLDRYVEITGAIL